MVTREAVMAALATITEAVDTLEARKDSIGKESLDLQVREFLRVRDLHDLVYEQKKRLHNLNEFYRNVQIPKTFELTGTKNYSLDSGEQFVLLPQMSVTTKDMGAAIEWVSDDNNIEGGAALVIQTLNASTLKTLAVDMASHGKELPEELFDVKMWMSTSVRKGKPTKKAKA